jgi:hypothetical protein
MDRRPFGSGWSTSITSDVTPMSLNLAQGATYGGRRWTPRPLPACGNVPSTDVGSPDETAASALVIGYGAVGVLQR